MQDPLLAKWGANIRTLRQSKGLSQAALARAIGVHYSGVSRWEAGQREPSRTHKARLAAELGTLVPVLFPHDTDSETAA